MSRRGRLTSGGSDRRLRLLAAAAWWFFAGALLSRGVLALATPGGVDGDAVADGVVVMLVLLAFPLAGVLILRRQPRNVVGWMLSAIGVVWAIGGYADGYAYYGLVVDPGSLPAPTVAGLVANGIWAPAIGLTGTFLFLLFPDGHLPGRRWRPLAVVSGAAVVLVTACVYASPGPLVEGPAAGLPNPWGIESLGRALAVALDVLIPIFAVCILASAVSLVVRFRRSRGTERQQLTWLAAAAATVGTVFLAGIASSLAFPDQADSAWQETLDNLGFLLLGLLPLTIGLAVLRYRLFDIDVVINRALVYGSLTVCLAGVYLGSVLLLQLALRPLTASSDLAVAASTLAVAAMFGPARQRIQSAVDRRFYRSRYDAARTLSAFGTRLRREIDIDTIGDDLVRTVHEAVQPTEATLWLRGAPGRERRHSRP
ncbi:hypothetical protein [Nocardioides sp. GXQ0305]|uniref:hypothetical protein n=1 Tax=Nocardioides sp. GXQ0305 TaxID=3423912 RepID=UPI003D7D1109